MNLGCLANVISNSAFSKSCNGEATRGAVNALALPCTTEADAYFRATEGSAPFQKTHNHFHARERFPAGACFSIHEWNLDQANQRGRPWVWWQWGSSAITTESREVKGLFWNTLGPLWHWGKSWRTKQNLLTNCSVVDGPLLSRTP